MELTPSQLQSHIRTAKKLDKIKDEVLEFIKTGMQRMLPLNSPSKCGKYIGITEYEVQQFILKKFKEENLTSGRMRPIVAVNKNSKDPHYTPTAKKKNSIIKEGSLIMIDLWAKEKGRDGIYADITWMAHASKGCFISPACQCGAKVGIKNIFKIVISARDETIKFIKKRLKETKPIQGYEADEVARDYITKRGYGKNFIHSIGHSLDKNVHGDGVSLSSVKRKGHKLARKKDYRKILQNMPFTIEPGIYLEDFGIRSEIDCYINDKNKLILTTETQKHIVEI